MHAAPPYHAHPTRTHRNTDFHHARVGHDVKRQVAQCRCQRGGLHLSRLPRRQLRVGDAVAPRDAVVSHLHHRAGCHLREVLDATPTNSTPSHRTPTASGSA